MQTAELRFRRSFNWGVLFIGDANTEFEADLQEHAGVRSGRFHAWIPVRHAQDVELEGDLPSDELVPPFEVAVTCRVLPVARPSTPVEILLDVPSGRISLGDADGELGFDLTSGQWLMQAVLDPPDCAEHVELLLSRALPGIDEL